jgi:uncharacterized membrane protein
MNKYKTSSTLLGLLVIITHSLTNFVISTDAQRNSGFVIERDCCLQESALSTTAIASDGLGFHMMIRVVALVPFVYTLHGRYLLQHPQTWHDGVLAAFFVLNGTT